MSKTKIELKKLNLGFGPDIGAPSPIVLADECNVYLLFYVSERNTGVALISFLNYASYKFGMPNDEAIEGHPYYPFGLLPYKFFEVKNSDWIIQLEQINSVHERHNKQQFKKYKHYIFFFHDSNFECVAESFTVEKLDITMKDAIKNIAVRLHTI